MPLTGKYTLYYLEDIVMYQKSSIWTSLVCCLIGLAPVIQTLGGNVAEARIALTDDNPVDTAGGPAAGTDETTPPVVTVTPPQSPLAPAGAEGWTRAHGDSDNSGFARVVTAPAVNYSTIADVGPVAPGANPVTGKDGTVYIGNLDGELIALHPDGTPFWKRKLESASGALFGGIHASPVVSADGSIFVISGIGFRDHREGNPPLGANSFLHKFTAGGGWVGTAPFPVHFGGTGATKAPPNIAKFGGTEAIIVPAQFGEHSQLTRIVAFSTDLGLLGDAAVTPPGDLQGVTPDWLNSVENGLYCFVPVVNWYDLGKFIFTGHSYCADDVLGFTAPATIPRDTRSLYSYLGSPFGVAIQQNSQAESPHIFVVDGLTDTAEFTFDLVNGFAEVGRSHKDDRMNLSTPVALSTGGIVIGKHTPHESLGGVSFEPELRYLWLDGDIVAAPTITPNGRIAAVASSGWLTTIAYGNLEKQEWHNGSSIASAASSCTHLFVATQNELVTYDLATMGWTDRLQWTDGGQHSTIIGPLGHVYATTDHGIYVFPPLANRDPKNVAGTQCTSDGSPFVPPVPTLSVQPASLNKTQIGGGLISMTATAVVTDGQAPFVYAWSSDGMVSVDNPNDAATRISAALTTCETLDSQARLTVTDARGRSAQATVPVHFKAPAPRGQACE